MDLIKDIARRDGLTVVMSLHQLDVAKTYADRIIALAEGKVTFDGPPNELSDAVIERVFKKPVNEIDEDQTVETTEASVE
jgi:phosphonate transport system ATP-binding protein